MTAPALRLRTGVMVSRPLFALIYGQLGVLMEENPLAVADARLLADNPRHWLLPPSAEALRKHGILREGESRPHDAIADIIRAAVDCDVSTLSVTLLSVGQIEVAP